MHIEGHSHFGRVLFQQTCLRPVSGNLPKTIIEDIEVSSVSPMMAAHEVRKGTHAKNSVHLVAMIVHQAKRIEFARTFIFLILLVHKIEIDELPLGLCEIVFPIVASPHLMDRKSGFNN